MTIFILRLGFQAGTALRRAGFGAIGGGALDNLLDLLPDGRVPDFLDLQAAGWHFRPSISPTWRSLAEWACC